MTSTLARPEYTAGCSAVRAADIARQRAAAYQLLFTEQCDRARTFAIASRAENELAQRLRPMSVLGWHLLEDRRWPATNANIDLILVGPGGVIVVDVKSWAESEARVGRVRILDEHSLVPWVIRRGARLSPDHVEELAQLLDTALPVHAQAASITLPTEPAASTARHGVRAEQDELLDAAALESALAASLESAPIEQWMTFLHPEQARVVRRLGTGASRVRGPAGTGKTVVALHRTAFAAEMLDGPILFTTFVKTLPPVLEGLFRTMAPGMADNVEFTHLHAWARRLLAERGRTISVDADAAAVALNRAWGRHGRGSCLEDLGAGWEYWKDEIEYVIKGRGITDCREYASLRRVGRRTRLLPAHRQTVWAIYEDYEQQLRDGDIVDLTDLLTLALEELQHRPLETPYSAVIADEVQDLNCQAVRLLAEIAGHNDQLLLIGDGQQQIYPGGFNLAEAGVSVNGRSTVLRVNYRNAAQILAAATRVVVNDEFDDLDERSETGWRDSFSAREGGRAWETEAASPETLRERAVQQVRSLVESGRDVGGIALLCATNREADHYLRLLTAVGVPCMPLAEYVGVARGAVKVGTVQRAKGLEFKDVVCPVTPRTLRPRRCEEAAREERERDHRTLFVAMTRALDTVWVGRVA